MTNEKDYFDEFINYVKSWPEQSRLTVVLSEARKDKLINNADFQKFIKENCLSITSQMYSHDVIKKSPLFNTQGIILCYILQSNRINSIIEIWYTITNEQND